MKGIRKKEGRKPDEFSVQLFRYNHLNLPSGLKCESMNMKSCFIPFAVQWKWYFAKFFLKAFQGTFIYNFGKHLPNGEAKLKHTHYKQNKTKQ